MALRHNIAGNPKMLGLAKSRLAQLRSIMGKKTKHLSQIVKTSDGIMKLRIAGANEYAFLNPEKWIEVIHFNPPGHTRWMDNWVHVNKKYTFAVRNEYHTLYAVLNDDGLKIIKNRKDSDVTRLSSDVYRDFVRIKPDFGERESDDVWVFIDDDEYSFIPNIRIVISAFLDDVSIISINPKYFKERGEPPEWMLSNSWD